MIEIDMHPAETEQASPENPIRGWKATHGMKCIRMKYEVGETYKLPADVKLELCENGFHFCQRQQDVLGYYNYSSDFMLLEVEAIGEVITRGDKSVTGEIRILRVVPKEEWEFMSGNTIRYEDSDGRWQTREYDERGNEIRCKNSGGFWWSKLYNEHDKPVYYENSDKDWQKCEYDEQGNLVRRELSNGTVYEFEWDCQRRLTRYNCSDGEIIEDELQMKMEIELNSMEDSK